jgi:tyrosine decarboxylase / aspartate 1-decarboxylase
MDDQIPYTFERDSLRLLDSALKRLDAGFADLPQVDEEPADRAAMEAILGEAADRFGGTYPYFHPLYAGQMLKPPHPIARAAYMLATYTNPNNHALDAGPASSVMEKEAVAEIASMFGWQTFLGHLTGGGTMANLEALWVAGQLAPGTTVVASQQAHYTHRRISSVLKLDFETIPCDRKGRIDIAALEGRLSLGKVGTVVATMGTTATGSVDSLSEILDLRNRYSFRIHADAAYGGYFHLVDTLATEAREGFDRLSEVDSIVIDPHKHGLQLYGCGCVLFKDPTVGRFYKHDSPYTYFSSKDLHLGEISLECSRPGASATALWATQKLLPLIKGGEFARRLAKSRAAAMRLYERLAADPRVITPFPPELDIVVWTPRAPKASLASRLARSVFAEAAKQNLHLALAELPATFFDTAANIIEQDMETVTCLRSVLMKPEHLDWIDRIWGILDASLRSFFSRDR